MIRRPPRSTQSRSSAASDVYKRQPLIDWTPALVGVVAYQGVLASGFAFWAQVVILRNIDPVSANLTMMGVPAVGVISSALLIGEQVTPELMAGLVLVTMGVTLNLLSD